MIIEFISLQSFVMRRQRLGPLHEECSGTCCDKASLYRSDMLCEACGKRWHPVFFSLGQIEKICGFCEKEKTKEAA